MLNWPGRLVGSSIGASRISKIKNLNSKCWFQDLWFYSAYSRSSRWCASCAKKGTEFVFLDQNIRIYEVDQWVWKRLCAWRDFKKNFMVFIIMQNETLSQKFHPCSILSRQTIYKSVAYCVLIIWTSFLKFLSSPLVLAQWLGGGK
jgi:hypothetical protein